MNADNNKKMEYDTRTRKQVARCATYSMADTLPAPYKTSDKTSFAFISARDRWPVIVV